MNKHFKHLFILMFLILTMSFVSAHAININFYDENSLSAIPTVTITDANGSTYTSDVNGLWSVDLVGAKSFEISKTGYDTRPFEFYFGADANYNFLLNPTGLDSSIGFIVKDTNDNLWTNKYLQFKSNFFINWTQRTSSFDTTDIQSVAYDNGVWVAVGNSGKLATATDPTGTWTQRTSSFGTSAIQSVAYGNGVWVAVGISGKLATATDPTGTWTQRTSSFGTTNISSVAYGNGVWVAVGQSGKLATATNPTGTWTQRTSSFDTTYILSVAYGNGVWVAVGQNGKLATATDPTGTWTQRTSSFDTTDIQSVAYDNGVWVAVGNSGKLATATDPTGTWTQRTSSFGSTNIWSVAYGNGVWVAAGYTGKLATATDPTGTWTQRTSSFSGTDNILSVAYGNGVWVAAGVTGKLATATYISLIINSLLTSSSGTATASILPAGDYNALLYNATGDLNYTYQKTTVTVNKPKDEITLLDISPYDVEVGGLLSYDLENQTDASIAFNVFAGTVNYYDITVVDYNATPADRLYIPRRYQVIVPMGTDYVQAYTVQPYLLAILDGVSPSVYTVDTFSRALSDIRVDVLKYMGGSLVLVESLFSDSVGKVNFSGYPLQTYYFKTYYNNTLMTTTSYVPTASTVPHYIIIDTIGQTSYVPSGNIMVDFSDTAESVGYNENLTANITVYSTLYANIVDVTIAWYDGATLLDSEVYNTPFTTNHVDITKLLTNPLSISKDTATTKIKVTVRYLDNGTTYSAYFYKIININSDPTIPTVFESMKTIGASSRLLTLFLSILITIALLFVIIRSGVVSSPNVITIIGLLILGFFVYVGWISTGVKIFGTDPLVFIYSIGVIIAIYFLSINQGN